MYQSRILASYMSGSSSYINHFIAGYCEHSRDDGDDGVDKENSHQVIYLSEEASAGAKELP